MDHQADLHLHRGRTSLRLAEVILALSLATDIGRAQPMGSGFRSCLLVLRLGQVLGLSEAELADAYYLALLRFAGCTAEAHLAALAFDDDLAFRAALLPRDYTHPAEMMRFVVGYVGAGRSPLMRLGTLAHRMPLILRESSHVIAAECEVAQNLAGRLGMGPQIQAALGRAFERWDGKGLPGHAKGVAIPRSLRVVQLAHDVEVVHRHAGLDAALAMARQRAGGAYDPEVVAGFCRHAATLCTALDAEATWEGVLAAEPGPRPALTGERLEEGTRAMADFADLKSPYTVGHSSAVAQLATAAAQRCGLPPADLVALRQAGYLHDLGRVGVSSAIWAKAGPLTEGEWESVRLHPYYTERILARSQPLASLGALGALHHERLDGSGYHRGLAAPLLPLAARLLAAADVYQAMTEPRPHRAALEPSVAAAELQRAVRAGGLDGDAAQAVLAVTGHRIPPTRRERVAGLSEREIEVLRLLARGLSNRQMAARLCVSPATVDHHVRHIYTKIGVSTRAAATLFAMQHHLIHDATEPSSVAAQHAPSAPS